VKISPRQLDQLVELAVQIQQVPAPTFHEIPRAEFLYQLFKNEGLSDIEIETAGNVYARLPGAVPAGAPPLVITAHLDTVFPPETSLQLRRQPDRLAGPGIGDNSIGLAGLVGLVWMLRSDSVQLPGDAWLVADTGEEGLGNLNGMSAVLERFKDLPRAYIVLEGMGLGEIFHRGLAVKRYRLTVVTAGGHSWIDFGRPSAIHEIARLINSLTSLVLPANPRTTLNVGIVSGGTSINTIASHASLELDLRSEALTSLQDLAAEVEDLVLEANHTGVAVYSELIGQRPAGSIPANHWLVHLAEQCLVEQGITPLPGIGSTDANVPLSQGLPAICIGLTTGSGAHTLEECINLSPLAKGMRQLYQLVTHIWSSPYP
jgi:acetylornithine deacetylase/succinyl-diaminopimelate desuccinylase-like protein